MALSLGEALPFSLGRPFWFGRRSGAGSNRLASSSAFRRGFSRTARNAVQPQPRDQADMAADGGNQTQSGEAAVGDDHHAAVGQPAFALQYGLAGSIGQGFVLLALRLAPSGRWRQNGQKWQRPSPFREGNRQYHGQR